MKYSRNYISTKCIFVLCIFILVDILGVSGDPLKIVNFTYRTKQLSLIDQTITSNIITLELDQEVFHKVQCPIEFAEANRTKFVPCCSSSPNVTGCYTPLEDGYDRTCLDANNGSPNINLTGTKSADMYQRYSFKVSNYATCHSVSILSKAISGQVFLAVSIRPEFRSASLFVNDFIRAEYGSNGLSLCCSRIRELNPAWTGEVYVGWEAYITTQYEFIVSTDPLLPVSEFYMIPPVEIQCDGLQFSAQQCRERSGCFPTPAADDPMFSLMKAIGGIEPYTAHPNRFSTGITIRKDQFVNARISNVAFPFPESRFSDPSCVFMFPTLANNQSEILGNAVGLPFKTNIPCDPVAFNETLTNFRDRITDLGNSSPRIYQETNEYFFRALLWVTSDDWSSCTDLVDRSLLQSAWREVTVHDSNMCIESNRSDAYLNDPCCNPVLQRTECCASRDVSGVVSGFEVASDAVSNMCETPRCVTNLLNDYITLSASTGDRRTGCAIRTTQAIGTGLDVLDELQACIRAVNVTYCNSDAYCTGIDASSVCLPTGVCSVPCTTDDECATQVCEVVPTGNRNVTSCKFIDFTDVENLSSEIIMSTAWRCVEINVDPFSVLFVKQDLGLNTASSRDEIVQTLVASGGVPACLGANENVPYDQCNNVRACNWAVCNSLTDPYCNIQNCTDPNLGSDYFCGACQSGFCAEVSIFAHCEYQNSATASECAAVGGSFNGLQYKGVVNQKCIRPTTTQSECFPPQFCSGSSCGAKCYSASRTASNCVLTSTNNVDLQWQTWTVGGQNYSLCVTSLTYTSRASCTAADPELSWWPGTTWVGGQLDDQGSCEMLGLCSGTPTLKVLCDSTKICTDGVSKNQNDCESNGGCDDFDGCVFDWDPVDFSCAQSLDWTPLGCFSYIVNDPAQCTSQGGRWLSRAKSRAECEAKAIVCREPKLAAVYNAIPTGRSVMPSEISLKNQTECVACDGVPVSYFSWTGYQWVPATFQPFEWRQREFVRSNLFVAIPSYDYFYDVLSASLARRYAKSLESDLWCRFGQFSESVSNLVCDCAAQGSACFSGVSSSVVGVGLVCSYIPTNITSDVAVIRAGSDLLIQGDDCMNVRTSVMPMSQFAAKQVSSLSAAAVSSVKSQQRRSVLFIRNDAGIVVGQVISDGVKVDRDPQGFTGTLEVCLTFPTQFQAELPVAQYRWAVPNEDFTQFALLDTVVNLGEVTCFSMANASQVYFPVGLQQSWQTADFVSTLFGGEIFFLVMGMVWYFVIFVFTGYHFVLHVMLRVPDASFFNLSTTALLISLIFLINRFIYMVLILSGAMDQNPQVEVVFSSFPALLFYVIYSIIVIRWAEIYHFTMTAGAKRGISRLRPAIIALNAILVTAFILLIVLFFALQDHTPVIYSCATPENQLTEKSVGDIVSIVYKAFFAVVSAVLSAMFVVYGIRVLMLMRAATKKSTKTADQKRSRESAFHRLMAVSGVCTVALLAQAIFLLWSSVTSTNQDEGRFYGILTFLYLTEMPPAIIFVIMFKKASAFVKGSRNSMTTRQTASQTDQHSLQVGSTTEEAGEN